MKKPFFSIGIIFKNEIRCLERCLKSFQPLREAVPCEIVMADTGSSDGSREIAEKYADILFDFEWIDDFSAARNAVMDRCSGEWYFSVDADEWLAEDISELIKFSKLKKAPRDFGGLMVRNYKTTDLEKSNHYVDFTAIRMARLATGIRYTSRIHEKWVGPNGEGLVVSMFEHTWLYHDGYAYFSNEATMQKHDRNMALLEKKLEEDPSDLQTYIECMDSSKGLDKKSPEYARQALDVFENAPDRWAHFGGVVYRGIVSVASIHGMDELEEWIEAAKEYDSSIFVNIDVAFDAFSHFYKKNDYEKAIPWGERFRKGLADYDAGNFDHVELLRGIVEHISPFWMQRLSVSLAECYLSTKEYESAFSTLKELSSANLDAEQTRFFTRMTLRLHREAGLDTAALMEGFWEALNREAPEDDESAKQLSQQRLAEFTRAAYEAFPPKYRKNERKEETFTRHSYTVFLPLEGRDTLGDAAAMLEESDASKLQEKLSRIEKLDDLPIHVIAHAIKQGVAFPPSGISLNVDEMDHLAARLANEKEEFLPMVERAAEAGLGQTLQSLCWNRGLALAAVRANDWNAEKELEGKVITLSLEDPAEPVEDVTGRSLAIARFFAQAEEKFLPLCYAPEALTEERLFILPPVHRFGWYCAQAFRKLDSGDRVAYLRLLREGLNTCESMKEMVEFLCDHVPNVQAPPPSAELSALAGQIRTILSNYAPDDPAVMLLKSSDAYQKVAHLIEGTAVPVQGGVLQ